MRSRPTFLIRLRAEPGIDAVRALRGFLKLALRRYGLRAIEAREERTNMSVYRDKINKLKSGVYKVADFQGNNGQKIEYTHTISHLDEDVEMFNPVREVDVLHFSDTGHELVLNMTNAEILMDLFGDEPDTWEGKRITLYLAPYGNEGKLGIRIRAADTPAPENAREETPAPKRAAATKPPFDDEIPY
jgi:hypothetical protein